ncbi:MAG TPA: L,D-transpeptidase [Candidatus Bathyarchaeia archaeon]|nr:L,D-transpeptidase [Candidatus Bathyarchaeia archaeon]
MAKNKSSLPILKFFTLFFPVLVLVISVLMIVGFTLFSGPSRPQVELTANITDGEFKPGEGMAFFLNQPVEPLAYVLSDPLFLADERVLAATNEEKWIEINLTKQRLYAHQGEEVLWEFPISSGKWGRTPAGDFRIWAKLKYTLMHGGSQTNNTYYYLPNVPYTQYFFSGYGIHGTYWHNNFGHPMSHGCINMYTPDAEKLFYWTAPLVPQDQWIVYPTSSSPGTRVLVHGAAPLE